MTNETITTDKIIERIRELEAEKVSFGLPPMIARERSAVEVQKELFDQYGEGGEEAREFRERIKYLVWQAKRMMERQEETQRKQRWKRR